MKQNRSKKIILTILIAVFVLFVINSTDIFAAINDNYSSADNITDENLEQAFEDSSILGLLARLIYAVGRFLEWILGLVFKMLTGQTDFPWADKVVFNSVALLDVNFINPAANSFVNNAGVSAVLKNIYSTVLSLSVAFFGITVLITAIKLVISTVASEKAKYKQAIVDWLVGFLMLFCMHYFISFTFYLNEELVKVASNMVTSQLTTGGNATVKVQLADVGKELIANIRSRGGFDDLANTLEKNPGLLTQYMSLMSNDASKGLHEFLMKEEILILTGFDINVNKNEQYSNLQKIMNWAKGENSSVQDISNVKVYSYRYVRYNSEIVTGTAISEADFNNIFRQFTPQMRAIMEANVGKVAGDVILNGTVGADGKTLTIDEKSSGKYYCSAGRFDWNSVKSDLIALKGASDTSTGKKVAGSGGSTRLIADLAGYFRFNAYNKELRTTNVTGVKNGDNIQIQNMIMYAILVAQSLILFISYIKRLFYVLMLAMLAPVVVVFDFFKKFGK